MYIETSANCSRPRFDNCSRANGATTAVMLYCFRLIFAAKEISREVKDIARLYYCLFYLGNDFVPQPFCGTIIRKILKRKNG